LLKPIGLKWKVSLSVSSPTLPPQYRLAAATRSCGRVLLVIRTQAAIEGAAEFGMPPQTQQLVAGLDELLAQPPIGGIGRDQHRRWHEALRRSCDQS